jgi:hypothetical protein
MGAVGALIGGLLVAAGGQPHPREDKQADIDPALCWVEVRGFEPLTPAVRRQCSTGLSYTPVRG